MTLRVPRRSVGILMLLGLFCVPVVAARTLRVGPGAEFSTVAAAAKSVQDGDTVEILAGRYPGDAAIWRANDIVVLGIGGRPHISADGRSVAGKGLWLVQGNDVVIENVELSGARVSDHNGAGIRMEGRNLTLRNCFIHHNENGVLGGRADPESTLRIENSEFAHNGRGDGATHGIYVGGIKELVVTGSHLHHTRVGHNVKSRAAATSLLYNRIADDADGNSSYLVDAPNGGRLVMLGNLLQQGPRTENYHLINFGTEGRRHSTSEIFIANNTLVNLRPEGSVFLREKGAVRVVLVNNVFWGKGGFESELADLADNLKVNGDSIVQRIWPTPVFRDMQRFDFRLVPGSPAVDSGVAVDPIDDVELRPLREYVHPASTRPRPIKGPLDMGAFELD